MDRQSTYGDISELLVSLLNGDSRVADSVRRALSTVGNRDNDTSRTIMHLLHQLPSLLTPHSFLEQYLDDTSRSSASRMSQSRATLGPSTRSDTTGFQSHGWPVHHGTFLEESTASTAVQSPTTNPISQHNLIAEALNAQSLEQLLVPAIINQILGQEQSHHDRRFPISDHLHHFRSGGGSTRENHHQAQSPHSHVLSFLMSQQSDMQSSNKDTDEFERASLQHHHHLRHIDTATGSNLFSPASLLPSRLGTNPINQDMIAQVVSAYIQMTASTCCPDPNNNGKVDECAQRDSSCADTPDVRKVICASSDLNRDDTLVDTKSGICDSPQSKRSHSSPLRATGSKLAESDKPTEETTGKRQRISNIPDEKCINYRPDSFLTRLRVLLDRIDHFEELKKISGWTPDGLAFAIHDRQAFVAKLLPLLMESSHFETFQVILGDWGFQSIEDGVYFHPWFRKNMPSLVVNVTPSQMRAVVSEQGWNSILTSIIIPAPTVQESSDGEDRKERPEGVEKSASTNSNHNSSYSGGVLEHPMVPDGTASSLTDRAPDEQLQDHSLTVSSSPPCYSHKADGSFRINETHDSYDVSGLMFPWQLHQMLDDAARDDKRSVGWKPDGASFFVQDHNMVVSTFIPKFFKRKMSWNEFTSELSSWGFVCFTAGPQKGSFIHRLHCKGKPSLCKQMRYKGKTVADILKNKAAFLLRLHETLAIMKDDDTSPAFWSADGMSFCVKNPQHFLQDTFSVFYESMSFTTFEQKLRSWGFVKQPANANVDVIDSCQHVHYFHPYFTRDKEPTIQRIARDMKSESISMEYGFLVRLRMMLDDVEKYGHQTIVSWLSHGKSFMIHDRSFFCDHILPHYFKTKLTSFRQTLRSYGFAQMGGNGWDSSSYYHKLFVRDDPSLCEGLSPEAMKQAMPEWIHPQNEPNFYADTTHVGTSGGRDDI